MTYSMGNILVIGNGFDLDLGLKTRYADFVNDTKMWPFSNYDALREAENNDYDLMLDLYLTKRKLDLESLNADGSLSVKWIDFEAELFHYALASSKNYNSSEINEYDKAAYDILMDKFYSFMRKAEKGSIRHSCCAAQVLKAIEENRRFEHIYSFNYTNFKHFYEEVTNSTCAEPVYLHGCLDKRNIILGISEDKNVSIGYHKLFAKSWNYSNPPNSLNSALLQADECVFFGFSFGKSDSMYFKPFFDKLIADYSPDSNKRKKVTIFTYSQSSMHDIEANLFELGFSIALLKQCIDLEFILTSAVLGNKCDSNQIDIFENFINRIKRRPPFMDIEVMSAH